MRASRREGHRRGGEYYGEVLRGVDPNHYVEAILSETLTMVSESRFLGDLRIRIDIWDRFEYPSLALCGGKSNDTADEQFAMQA